MIFFDHLYTVDDQHKFLGRLEEIGFKIDERQTLHPGGHDCRFIYFKSTNPRGRFYLEFIHVRPGGEQLWSSGLSLGYSARLANLFKKVKRSGRYKSKMSHRNYRWRMGDRTRQPGWNFLLFQNLGFRGIYPWVTEHEPAPFIKPKKPPRKHPNDVFRHVGFEMELNEKSCRFFSYLLGQRLNSTTTLRCGTKLYIKHSRRTRMNAVILKCKNINRFISKCAPDEVFDFHGRKATRIINRSGMWDLIVV